MKRLSNVRVRNVATVGGALAHGDPHMDLPPVLMALGAKVRIVGANGERELAVEDLLTGYYETALKAERIDCEPAHPGAGQDAHGLYERSPPARPMTGRRSASRWRLRWTAPRSNRRAWW